MKWIKVQYGDCFLELINNIFMIMIANIGLRVCAEIRSWTTCVEVKLCKFPCR